MDWNVVQLKVENIYDRLNIGFTPFFLDAVICTSVLHHHALNR